MERYIETMIDGILEAITAEKGSHVEDAWEDLLDLDLGKSDLINALVYIIRYAPSRHKKRAWEELLVKVSTSLDTLRTLEEEAPEPYSTKAKELIKKYYE